MPEFRSSHSPPLCSQRRHSGVQLRGPASPKNFLASPECWVGPACTAQDRGTASPHPKAGKWLGPGLHRQKTWAGTLWGQVAPSHLPLPPGDPLGGSFTNCWTEVKRLRLLTLKNTQKHSDWPWHKALPAIRWGRGGSCWFPLPHTASLQGALFLQHQRFWARTKGSSQATAQWCLTWMVKTLQIKAWG